jgi:8-oxo-dGTP pyrophosphatase MutT (NUDIX family)
MKVSANAVVVNKAGEVLLILRDDVRLWGLPGGMLDGGETPAEAVVREVYEETGIQVNPVRLMGLQFWPLPPCGTLEFNFLCKMVGGQLTPSPESPQVGFFPSDHLPRPLLHLPHRQELIVKAIDRRAEPPTWQTNHLSWSFRIGYFLLVNLFYRFKNWRRRRQGNPYLPPPWWQVEVYLLFYNKSDQILWGKAADASLWRLPGGQAQKQAAPWDTVTREVSQKLGVRVALTALVHIEVDRPTNRLTLVFTATTLDTFQQSPAWAYFALAELPTSHDLTHLGYVAETRHLTR